jgi:hypothetical protein
MRPPGVDHIGFQDLTHNRDEFIEIIAILGYDFGVQIAEALQIILIEFLRRDDDDRQKIIGVSPA